VAYGPSDEVLVPPVLEATYGHELVVLAGGERAVSIQHCDHDHDHA
jgi:hypothetical protein